MSSGGDREQLAKTFDRAAEFYQRARPEYPPSLFDHLVSRVRLEPGARVLEIGCATGKATVAMARRGYAMTCLEPGRALAAKARSSLSSYDVAIVESSLEAWDAGEARFELVFAATSWHWLDPAVRFRKAAQLLLPRGHLAVWAAIHVFPRGGDSFFEELQEVYDAIGEGVPPEVQLPRPHELPDFREEFEASGLFTVVDVSQFDWETIHDADGYIELLDTFSGHIAMDEWQRDRLYGEIRRRLQQRPDGLLRRHWGAVLQIAQRVD